MIKKCKVLSYNPHQKIVVVRFDKIQVQLPCETPVCDTCYIKQDNGVYSISSKLEFEKAEKASRQDTENGVKTTKKVNSKK